MSHNCKCVSTSASRGSHEPADAIKAILPMIAKRHAFQCIASEMSKANFSSRILPGCSCNRSRTTMRICLRRSTLRRRTMRKSFKSFSNMGPCSKLFMEPINESAFSSAAASCTGGAQGDARRMRSKGIAEAPSIQKKPVMYLNPICFQSVTNFSLVSPRVSSSAMSANTPISRTNFWRVSWKGLRVRGSPIPLCRFDFLTVITNAVRKLRRTSKRKIMSIRLSAYHIAP
mmetsp:Transcript_9976/g.14381  ORF Transcript_9976/g.14381 Transcript_9976/m.14381 type:complete len:230 (-) Transcript_9976:69-758(-)